MQRLALAVIGSGSGNVAIPEAMSEKEVALIECGSFGGTCVNRGCIPSKMFIYTADLAVMVREASHFGLSTTLRGSIGRRSETGSFVEWTRPREQAQGAN